MSGINQRLRVSSNTITLSKAFAEEHGADLAALCKPLFITMIQLPWEVQQGLEETIKRIASHPYGGLMFKMSFARTRNARGHGWTPTTLGDNAAMFYEAAVMSHEDGGVLLSKMKEVIARAPIEGIANVHDVKCVQGAGVSAICNMSIQALDA